MINKKINYSVYNNDIQSTQVPIIESYENQLIENTYIK